MSRRLFVPFHDDGIISHFEGYEDLEELDWDAYRAKYGNKAVRAYLRRGHEVFPVNPGEKVVEGLPAYASVSGVPGPILHSRCRRLTRPAGRD